MATPAPVHVHQIYIRASADRVWQAITDPAFTRQYFFRTALESTLEPGSSYRLTLPDGEDAVAGTIEEVDPPRKLVMTWRVLYDAGAAEEPPSRVEWHLLEGADGVTKVTTIHRDLGLSPLTSSNVGADSPSGGWNWVLQSMKSLVETGEPLPGSAPVDDDASQAAASSVADAAAEAHRTAAIDANNSAWELLGRDDPSDTWGPDEADDLLGRVYAAAHHWRRAARRGPENAVRASWLISRAHAVLGHGDLALHHADRCLAAATSGGLQDFDLAYAYESRARALACLGRLDEAAAELNAARAVSIVDDEDRSIFIGDLESDPWYGLTT